MPDSAPYKHCFLPAYHKVGTVHPSYALDELRDEIELTRVPLSLAQETSGPVVQRMLNMIPDGFLTEAKVRSLPLTVDVRLHYLDAGEILSYRGWHADGEHYDDVQPNLKHAGDRLHLFCSVSTRPDGVTHTQMMTTPLTLTVNPANVWEEVNRDIAALPASKYQTLTIHDGSMYQLDGNTLHRILPAHNSGSWLFFRVRMGR